MNSNVLSDLMVLPTYKLNSRLQPILNLKSESVIGGELLSTIDGIVNVERFFSSITDSCLVELVIKQVKMINATRFRSQHIHGRYFINIRYKMLSDKDFVLWICKNSNVSLSLEIDCQDLVLNGALYINNEHVSLLQRHGHQIWLDDFNCAFNQHSISLLSRIKWDGIKVDKSILWSLCHDEISLKHLVRCCREFAEHILIEGVETNYHLDVCKKSGFDYGQGFHWHDLELPSVHCG